MPAVYITLDVAIAMAPRLKYILVMTAFYVGGMVFGMILLETQSPYAAIPFFAWLFVVSRQIEKICCPACGISILDAGWKIPFLWYHSEVSSKECRNCGRDLNLPVTYAERQDDSPHV